MARNKGIQDDETQAVEQAADEVGVPLPDIKQALQRKAIEKEMEKIEEEEEANRVKIKRTDKEAFAKQLNWNTRRPCLYYNHLSSKSGTSFRKCTSGDPELPSGTTPAPL